MTSLDAIVHSTSAAVAGLTGGAHWGAAETASTAMPYAVLDSGIVGLPDPDSSGDFTERRQYVIRVFATSRATARTILAALEAAFHGQEFTLDEGACVRCDKAGDAITLDPDRMTGGHPVWMATLTIEFLVYRSAGDN